MLRLLVSGAVSYKLLRDSDNDIIKTTNHSFLDFLSLCRTTHGASCTPSHCSRPWAICCVLAMDARPRRACLISGSPCWAWLWEPPVMPCSSAMPLHSSSRWTHHAASTRKRLVTALDCFICHLLFDLSRSKSAPIACLVRNGLLWLTTDATQDCILNLASLLSDPPATLMGSALILIVASAGLFTAVSLLCSSSPHVTNHLASYQISVWFGLILFFSRLFSHHFCSTSNQWFLDHSGT